MNGLMKATLVGLLVNLCATNVAPANHNVDIGLLAAHELSLNPINYALLHQDLNSFWSFHMVKTGAQD